ncbi:unnamed protein product, partial [marine sediment metagenome]
GLDGHDRGVKLIACYMRDAGMEVVYGGLFQTVDQIVSSAIQEDVNIIGLSILDGFHMLIAEDIMGALRERGINDIIVIIGGIIPEEDVPTLKERGIKEVFGPGSSMTNIISRVEELVSSQIVQ